MPVESDADRLALLEDFGEECTVTIGGVASPGVLLLFRQQYLEVPLGDGQMATGEKLTALGRSSDLAGANKSTSVLRAAVPYGVIATEPDGAGMVRLILQES